MRSTLALSRLATAALLSACLPAADPEATALLRSQVERLEQKLKETELLLTEREVAARETSTLLKERVDRLERHATENPPNPPGTQEALHHQMELTQAQMMEFQRALNQLFELTYTGQSWIHFGLGYAGHSVARTPHGSFLIELRSQDPAPDGKGHLLKLRIGNSTGLTVHRFKLSGHFGSPPPEKDNATERSSWESSLRPFDQSFSSVLPSSAWKEVDLLLPSARLADLRFVRMRMEVERASLPEASESGPEPLRISLQSKGGFILHTDHGAIIMAIQGHRQTSDGYEIDVRFGNPLGLTITRCTLQGRYGPEPPKPEAFPELEAFRLAHSEWQHRIRSFEIDVSGEILPFTWNSKTLRFRTQDPAELAFIECHLQVKNISLRQP